MWILETSEDDNLFNLHFSYSFIHCCTSEVTDWVEWQDCIGILTIYEKRTDTISTSKVKKFSQGQQKLFTNENETALDERSICG